MTSFDNEGISSLKKKSWEEEEDSDSSIPDNWDESEEESESEDEAPKAKPAAKPKAKPVKQEEPSDEESEDEDEETQRLRARKLQQEADLKNTEDLFSGLSIRDNNMNKVLSELNPKTQAEFDEFQKAIVERVQKADKSRLYTGFLEKLIRDLVAPLKDTEVRKFASALTSLANEKQRLAREAVKPKKKNKKALVAAPPKDQMDMTDYSRGHYEDDDDDFM